MRQIDSHRVNLLNEHLAVTALDEPGHGNAYHRYTISAQGRVLATVDFQNGPIAEAGVNGVSNEALLAILIDRLEGFQSGKFACAENREALASLKMAQHWLHERTRDRTRKGVEGTLRVTPADDPALVTPDTPVDDGPAFEPIEGD